MLILILFVIAWAVLRLVLTTLDSLRDLPRSNEDWVWW